MQNDGIASQKQFFEFMKECMDKDPSFTVGEFADSRKARNFVAPNPSDYYACYKETPWLVEIKSSVDLQRFPFKKNIKGTQFGIGRRYMLSGWKYMFVIHHVIWDRWFFVPFKVFYDLLERGESSIPWDFLIKNFEKEFKHKFWSI